MSAKPDINIMPNKSIQIFLHPYLFEGSLENMPNYIEVVSPDVAVFDAQIHKYMNNIEQMCSGLNEDHIKYALMTSSIIVYLYSNRKINGMMALNGDGDALHVDIICTNSAHYKNIGTYLMDVANMIALQLGKTTITLDAVDQAIPFYQRIGFYLLHKEDSNAMQKAVESKPLPSISNTITYRRSARHKGGHRKRKSKKCNKK